MKGEEHGQVHIITLKIFLAAIMNFNMEWMKLPHHHVHELEHHDIVKTPEHHDKNKSADHKEHHDQEDDDVNHEENRVLTSPDLKSPEFRTLGHWEKDGICYLSDRDISHISKMYANLHMDR
jgi:hypothetical protein